MAGAAPIEPKVKAFIRETLSAYVVEGRDRQKISKIYLGKKNIFRKPKNSLNSVGYIFTSETKIKKMFLPIPG